MKPVQESLRLHVKLLNIHYGVRKRTKTCSFDPQWIVAEGSEEEKCVLAACKVLRPSLSLIKI